MINKILNWILLSSQSPSEAALTAKGLLSFGVVQVVFNNLLPLLGVHPSFDLNTLGDAIYSVVFSVLNLVSAAAALMGIVRKVWYTFFVPSGTPKA